VRTFSPPHTCYVVSPRVQRPGRQALHSYLVQSLRICGFISSNHINRHGVFFNEEEEIFYVTFNCR
jgi:hypothetical protein